VWINGYGFPPHRGGPMFYADTIGLPKIHAALEQFVAKFGKVWQPSALLAKLAKSGGTFAAFDAGKA
jgi:3-hydroxyacyl-CoA dehydrogenase